MARNKGLNFAKRRRRVNDNIGREIFSYVIGIAVAVVLAFFLVYNWGMKTSVIGASMEPSLYNGQTIFISKLSYLFTRPKAGDVIVFKPNGNQNTHYYVKRVVATPGDKIEFKGGRFFVNDVEEKGSYDKVADPGIAAEPMVLQQDEYFVLGDNRNNSEDSRSGNIGPVQRSLIEGRAWFKLSTKDSYTGFVK